MKRQKKLKSDIGSMKNEQGMSEIAKIETRFLKGKVVKIVAFGGFIKGVPKVKLGIVMADQVVWDDKTPLFWTYNTNVEKCMVELE